MADTLPAATTDLLASVAQAETVIAAMRAALTDLNEKERACWALSGRDGNKKINGYSGTQRIAHMATMLAAIPADVMPTAGVIEDFSGFINKAWDYYKS